MPTSRRRSRVTAATSGALHGAALAALATLLLMAISWYQTHLENEEGLYDDAQTFSIFLWDTAVFLLLFGLPAALLALVVGALYGLASLPYARRHSPRATGLACGISAALLLAVPAVPALGSSSVLIALGPPGWVVGALMAHHGSWLSRRLHAVAPDSTVALAAVAAR